jgi:hypothetical protein
VRDDSTLYVHTTFNDDPALERNKQLRNADLLAKAKFYLHDNEDIRMFISCPDTTQWWLFKRDYPDIYKALSQNRDEAARMKACRQLQILHPEWVVQERL